MKFAKVQILITALVFAVSAAAFGQSNGLNPVNLEGLEADHTQLQNKNTEQFYKQEAEFQQKNPTTSALPAAGSDDSDSENAEPTCSEAASKAKSACNPFSAAGLEDGSSAIIEAALTNQITSSLATSCKAAKNVSMVMGAISAGRAAWCKTSQNSCIKACTASSSEEYEAGNKALASRCRNYEGPFMMQVMQTLAYTASILGSGKCQSASQGGINVGTAPTPISFEVNCDDATQKATNPVCICKANPQNSQCNPFASGSGRGTASTSSRGDGSFGSMSDLGDGIGGGDDSLLGPPTGSGGGNSANKVAEIGGGGGGGPQGAGGGSGGGSGGNGATGADAGSGFKTDMMSGGGGAGGGFAGYGRGKGGDDDGGSSALDKLKGMFNMKDALPDKDKLAKGLAGMSKEAAADGITGAMGESLFQKATRQYKNQESRGSFIGPKR